MFIGIDVGGTNLKAGLVEESGRLLAVERTPLDFQGAESFAETTARLAETVARKGVSAKGILVVCTTTPRRLSTRPGNPTPTA